MRCYFKGVARDEAGNILAGATVAIYLAGTVTAASAYTSLAGATPVNSVTAGADGTFELWVSRFDYDSEQLFKFIISLSGYTSTTWDDIAIDQVVLGTYAIATDRTVTTHLVVPKGVLFAPGTGVTLTISGVVDAGAYQIFIGTGTVTVSTYPQDQAWWGSTQRLDVTGLTTSGAASIGGNLTLSGNVVGNVTASGEVSGSDVKIQTVSVFESYNTLNNIALVYSVADDKLTIALKTAAGADPSATDPIKIAFRSETITESEAEVVTITSAISLTTPTASTHLSAPTGYNRYYVWLVKKGTTVELGLSRNGSFSETKITFVYSITNNYDGTVYLQSSSNPAIGASVIRCIGSFLVNFTSDDAWKVPAEAHMMGPGVKRTGDIVQTMYDTHVETTAITATIPADNTKPQDDEGYMICGLYFKAQDYANILHIEGGGMFAVASGGAATDHLTLAISSSAMYGVTTNTIAASTMKVAAEDVAQPKLDAFIPVTGAYLGVFRYYLHVGCATHNIYPNSLNSTTPAFNGLPKVFLRITEIQA